MISSFLCFISNFLTMVIMKSYLRDFRCVGGACGGANPWKLITINQLLEADKSELRSMVEEMQYPWKYGQSFHPDSISIFIDHLSKSLLDIY